MQMAAAAGVTHQAVTDHDTVAGLAEAEAAGKTCGVALVPGIEISAYIQRREVHILGHFLPLADPSLEEYSLRLRGERAERMRGMVERMQALGYPVTFEEVQAVAAGGQLGRPHLARVLIDRGICRSFQEAFDRFLVEGKPGYVDRDRLTAADAIAMVRRVGGVPTVAHPGASRLGRSEIVAMRNAGLEGIEIHRNDQNPALKNRFLKLAKELHLIPTAGSDFHGAAITPHRKLGSASMAPELFEALRERRGRANALTP